MRERDRAYAMFWSKMKVSKSDRNLLAYSHIAYSLIRIFKNVVSTVHRNAIAHACMMNNDTLMTVHMCLGWSFRSVYHIGKGTSSELCTKYDFRSWPTASHLWLDSWTAGWWYWYWYVNCCTLTIIFWNL